MRVITKIPFAILDLGQDKNNKEERFHILLEADANHDGILTQEERNTLKPLLTAEAVALGGEKNPVSLCVDIGSSVEAHKAQNDAIMYFEQGITLDTAYTEFLTQGLAQLLLDRNLVVKH